MHQTKTIESLNMYFSDSMQTLERNYIGDIKSFQLVLFKCQVGTLFC